MNEKDLVKVVGQATALQNNPELGFNEFESSALVKSFWESLGLKVEGPFGLTGIKARIKGAHPGPSVALIGELDAIYSPSNRLANSEGIAHACGHNIQVAQVCGAASILVNKAEKLFGDVVLMAVPAEEFIELQKRLKLKEEKKISYLSGKEELLSLGAFDDVDMAVMIHAQPSCEDYKLFLDGTNLGFAAKKIRFLGKSAHGAEPFSGKNALDAATLFFSGVNANRSTFRDEESIRIHPIITKGGDTVNCVPDDVQIETYIRGATRDAINKGCVVVDRCVKAAAMMIDCNYQIETIPGYLPLVQSKELSEELRKIAIDFLGPENVCFGVNSVGSSDIGDLSQLIPTIQPTMGGFRGELHSAEFCPVDINKSCLYGSQLLSALCCELLKDEAKKAKVVINSFHRSMTKKQYFDYLFGETKC